MSSTKNVAPLGCKDTMLTLTRGSNSTKAEYEGHSIGFPVEDPQWETWDSGLRSFGRSIAGQRCKRMRHKSCIYGRGKLSYLRRKT